MGLGKAQKIGHLSMTR